MPTVVASEALTAARTAMLRSTFLAERSASRTVMPLPVVRVLSEVDAEPVDPAWRALGAAASEDLARRAAEAERLAAEAAEAAAADAALDAEWQALGIVEPDFPDVDVLDLRLLRVTDADGGTELCVQAVECAAASTGMRASDAGWDEESIGWRLIVAHRAGRPAPGWTTWLRLLPLECFSDDFLDLLGRAPNAESEVDPVFTAVDALEAAQQASQRADAARVVAAVQVWRTALASDAGRGSAVDGPFQRGVLMQLAHSLRVAERTASSMVVTAEALERDLPGVWQRFIDGLEPWRAMQIVHAAVEGLRDEVLPAFDAGAVRELGRVALPRLKDALRRLRERLQASTAPERHEAAVARRSVTLEPGDDGMAHLTWYGPAPEAVALDHQLSKAALAAHGADGDTRTVTQLRADILMDLWLDTGARDASDSADVTVPARRGVVPTCAVLIPAMTAMGHGAVPATLEGYGPIDVETAKRLAGAAPSWIRVLTDPVDGVVLTIGRDRYRPTADMRTLLGLLDGGGRGPGCAVPPKQTEADHVEAFRQGLGRGRTALDNLVLLARRHHRVKTSGDWSIELLADRTLVWTSRFGRRIITAVPDGTAPTPVPDDR